MKIPPPIHQFSNTLDTNNAKQLLKLLHKYRPENKKEKKERLKTEAAKKAEGNLHPPKSFFKFVFFVFSWRSED